MDSKAFDASIANATTERDQLAAKLDAVTNRFIEYASKFVAGWIPGTVESTVKSKAEKTRALGLEKLRELKRESAELVTKAPQLAQSELSSPSVWPHRGRLENSDWRYSVSDRGFPKQLEVTMRSLLGHAGRLLAKHGFVTSTDFPWGTSTDYSHGHSGALRYTAAIDWPRDLIEIAKEYQALYMQFARATSTLDNLTRKKVEAEAADLWNQA